jgi:hypothetical protein
MIKELEIYLNVKQIIAIVFLPTVIQNAAWTQVLKADISLLEICALLGFLLGLIDP